MRVALIRQPRSGCESVCVSEAKATRQNPTIQPETVQRKIRREQAGKTSSFLSRQVVARPLARISPRIRYGRGVQVLGRAAPGLTLHPPTDPLSTWPGRPPGSGLRPAQYENRYEASRRRGRCGRRRFSERRTRSCGASALGKESSKMGRWGGAGGRTPCLSSQHPSRSQTLQRRAILAGAARALGKDRE